MPRFDRQVDLPDLALSAVIGLVSGEFLWRLSSSLLVGLLVPVLSIAAALLRIRKRHEQD